MGDILFQPDVNLLIKRMGILILCVAVLTACGLLGGSNDDDGPPRTIVFSAQNDEEGTFQIFSMREDGSGVKQLTDGEFSSTNPAWSPDGSRIAYARSTGSTAGDALWVMEADGSKKEPLVTNPRTGAPQLGNHPAWSPDGTKLAFDRCLNCEFGGSNFEIFVADLQTGAIDTLTDHPVEDSQPTWSPDGQQIAFTSNRDFVDADTLRFRKGLYVINAEGTNLKRLTENGFVGKISWHPEGRSIAFAANGLHIIDLPEESIAKIELDLSEELQSKVRPVVWSDDGEQLMLAVTEEFPNSAFYLFNNTSNTIERIPFDAKQILGADWFTSFDNQN